MTDSTGTSTEGAPPEGTPTDSTPDNKTTFDADYVKGLRSEAAGHRTNLRAVEAERDELRTQLEAATATSTDSTSRLATAESLALRYEVALEKGLPLDLAKRLVGDDRDSLVADADGLRALLGDQRPPVDLGQGPRDEVKPPKDVNAALRALARP